MSSAGNQLRAKVNRRPPSSPDFAFTNLQASGLLFRDNHQPVASRKQHIRYPIIGLGHLAELAQRFCVLILVGFEHFSAPEDVAGAYEAAWTHFVADEFVIPAIFSFICFDKDPVEGFRQCW